MPESSEEFEFLPDPTTVELAALERVKQVAQRATIAHLRANVS